MKICALQLPTLSMSPIRLEYYLKICAQSGVNLVVLGEYVLNNFFRDLIKMPLNLIKDQSIMRKKILCELCEKSGVTIIAPLVINKNDGFYKVCAKFSKNSVRYFEQSFLMPYSHWNEKAFFANSHFCVATFRFGGLKFGILNAYETNFDVCWQEIMRKNVDIVLVPSACAFFSKMRWVELLKTRAFTNSVYILQVNRVGEHKYENEKWKFYGQSMLIDPFGEIEDELGNAEEMLLVEINKKQISKARAVWKFRSQLENKELL